jgi:hypothetical protein
MREIMDRAKSPPPCTGKENRTGEPTPCTAARYRSLAVGAWAVVLIGGELDRSGRTTVLGVPCTTLAWACCFGNDACPRNEAEDMLTQP